MFTDLPPEETQLITIEFLLDILENELKNVAEAIDSACVAYNREEE